MLVVTVLVVVVVSVRWFVLVEMRSFAAGVWVGAHTYGRL